MSRMTGFTLIELCVVIFVIALVAGLTTFALGGFQGRTDFEHAVEKLAHQLRVAQAEAVFEQAHMGLAVDEQGYQFYRRPHERADWQVIEGNSAFHSGQMPSMHRLQVKVSGQSLHLSQDSPQIVITPHEIRDFELHMVDLYDHEFIIQSDAGSQIKWAVK